MSVLPLFGLLHPVFFAHIRIPERFSSRRSVVLTYVAYPDPANAIAIDMVSAD